MHSNIEHRNTHHGAQPQPVHRRKVQRFDAHTRCDSGKVPSAAHQTFPRSPSDSRLCPVSGNGSRNRNYMIFYGQRISIWYGESDGYPEINLEITAEGQYDSRLGSAGGAGFAGGG